MDKTDQPAITRRGLLKAGLASAAGVAMHRWTHSAVRAAATTGPDSAGRLPNIILAMTDDQGWGDTGYNGHKVLRTPTLDEMAAAGLRFNRFYAAAPVCSPTRGSCLTGRHPNRFGCFTHGRPIRPQELTIAQAVRQAGYTTGHFGKWHLNGRSGAGVPIAAGDPLNPGRVGFDQWLSVSNYFDLDPAMSRNGQTVQFTGDGSDIIVEEAVRFIGQASADRKPFLAVVWFGSPHDPHRALDKDKAAYAGRSAKEQNYYGELAAVDRAMGRLRQELRRLGIADNTMLWFCSDNGATGPGSTGGLRGKKGTIWEGGVRVPGILEWPARVKRPFTTDIPCCTSDYYPTVLDLLGLTPAGQPLPIDGVSLMPLIAGRMDRRPRPIGFWVHPPGRGDGRGEPEGHAALTDNRYKLHKVPNQAGQTQYMLYDLEKDPAESTDLLEGEPKVAAGMKAALEDWQRSVQRSLRGEDYPPRGAG